MLAIISLFTYPVKTNNWQKHFFHYLDSHVNSAQQKNECFGSYLICNNYSFIKDIMLHG